MPLSDEAIEKKAELFKKLTKKFGSTVIKDASDPANFVVDRIPTGVIQLDALLGGGIPCGKFTEFWGDMATGKSTLSYSILRQAQLKFPNRLVALINAESRTDLTYMTDCGVNMAEDALTVYDPANLEEVLEIIEECVRSGLYSCIVWDSVPSLAPEVVMAGEVDGQRIGVHARRLQVFFTRMVHVVSQQKVAIVMLNQVRMNINGGPYAPQFIRPGGKSMDHASENIIQLSKKENIKKGDDAIGITVQARMTKAGGSQFSKVEYDIYFGTGVSIESSLIDFGAEMKVIKKSGPFYYYGDVKLGQGKEAAREFLIANSDVAEKLNNELQNFVNPKLAGAKVVGGPKSVKSKEKRIMLENNADYVVV